MRVLILFLFLSVRALAHPGVGVVKDSRGAIFYTDLAQVWKISGGRKTIAVASVHTHELYLDSADNLYGEHQWNDAAGQHFYHQYWRLAPDGRLDTVVGNRPAFVNADFPLGRDPRGAAYFLKPEDTAHIFRRSGAGQEVMLATGAFKDIKWLHPQADGSVFYTAQNTIFRLGADGTTSVVAKDIGEETPSFYYTTAPTIFGAWQDGAGNVYAAVFSDQALKKN